MYSVEV